jgi:hypothetical protein
LSVRLLRAAAALSTSFLSFFQVYSSSFLFVKKCFGAGWAAHEHLEFESR